MAWDEDTCEIQKQIKEKEKCSKSFKCNIETGLQKENMIKPSTRIH